MSDRYFTVSEHPDQWNEKLKACHAVVSMEPWKHTNISLQDVFVKGRKSWMAPEPIWKNEVIYYNTHRYPLQSTLNNIVVHHTNNSNSINENERKQQSRKYAALGYHFFIDKSGVVFEGRPLEIMGSHAGQGIKRGPLNDPDWGSVGIVLQGDYHHADDWFIKSESPVKQLKKLEKLICAIKSKYCIQQLLMHREIKRAGKPTVCPGDHLASKIIALRKNLCMSGPKL